MFSLTFTSFNVAASTKTLDQWIKYFTSTGTSLFYSSDFLSTEQLNQPIALRQDDISELKQALKNQGLQLSSIDSNVFVIRPETTTPMAVILIHAFDASTHQKIKSFQLTVEGQAPIKSQAGSLVLTEKSSGTAKLKLNADGYYTTEHEIEMLTGKTQTIDINLERLPLALSDILVSTSQFSFNSPDWGQQRLSRQELSNQVVINRDPLRSTERLASTTSDGITGKVHTRGGQANESLVVFDNQELRNPYHFKNMMSLFSTINDTVVDSIDYYSGVFPVQYGGRLSAVLDVQSNELSPLPSHDLNVSLLTTSYTYRNTSNNKRYYLVALRSGGLLFNDHLIDDLNIKPEYDDGYLKAVQTINNNWEMSQHILFSRDEISVDQNNEMAIADNHDQNMWLQWHFDNLSQHQMHWQLYGSSRHDRRQGWLDDENSQATVDEEITSHFQGFKFNHQWQINENLLLSYGIDAAVEDTRITSYRQIEHSSQLADALGLSKQRNSLFDFDQHGFATQLFANTRYQFNDQWTVDLGFHHQYQQWIKGGTLSPRLNVAYFMNENTTWRFGFGRHQQAQHIDELLLEDEQPQYFEPASADLAVLELNHHLNNGWHFRSEIYLKKYSQTHPYYENLFNNLHVLPDLFFDRIRIDADDAQSLGAEFSLTGQYKQIDWLASYTYSDTIDEIGAQQIARSWNQQNAFKLQVNIPIHSWNLNVNADIHNGWPLTGIALTDSGLTLLPRNEETFKNFYQVSAQLNTSWQTEAGEWQFEFQLSNALNTENPCCRSYKLTDNGLEFEEKYGLPIVPNLRLGLSWD